MPGIKLANPISKKNIYTPPDPEHIVHKLFLGKSLLMMNIMSLTL